MDLKTKQSLSELTAMIAHVCYEANRTYNNTYDGAAQKPWSDIPEWHQLEYINGVEFIIENPDATPCESHTDWAKYKRAHGWYRGLYAPARKHHPCMMNYEDLTIEQQVKSYIFCGIVKAYINSGAILEYKCMNDLL